MKIEKTTNYIDSLKEDLKAEGEGQEPMLCDGFVRHLENILKLLQAENSKEEE